MLTMLFEEYGICPREVRESIDEYRDQEPMPLADKYIRPNKEGAINNVISRFGK